MSGLLVALGLGLVGFILFDAFEAIVSPRRVSRRLRPTRIFYRTTWAVWRRAVMLLVPLRRRENVLSIFGPLSLLGLFSLWAASLIVGFGLIYLGTSTALSTGEEQPSIESYLYLSGTTFFTLGYGDLTPTNPLGRVISVIEAGTGFGFVALIIGYLPVLYQAYSRREQTIELLDARASSPPTAGEFVRRLAVSGELCKSHDFLREWEVWAVDLLESHLSFPVLGYYRSQHENQSWLAALSTILDTCSLMLVAVPDGPKYQLQVTFAMARHVAVDLTLVLRAKRDAPQRARLDSGEMARLLDQIRETGAETAPTDAAEKKLSELRAMYEPFLEGLAHHFSLKLPRFVAEHETHDNWQTSAWQRRTPGIGNLPGTEPSDEHFS